MDVAFVDERLANTGKPANFRKKRVQVGAVIVHRRAVEVVAIRDAANEPVALNGAAPAGCSAVTQLKRRDVTLLCGLSESYQTGLPSDLRRA